MPNTALPMLRYDNKTLVEEEELRFDKPPGGAKRWIGGIEW